MATTVDPIVTAHIGTEGSHTLTAVARDVLARGARRTRPAPVGAPGIPAPGTVPLPVPGYMPGAAAPPGTGTPISVPSPDAVITRAIPLPVGSPHPYPYDPPTSTPAPGPAASP